MAAVLKHWREAATLMLVSSSKLSRVGFQLVSNSNNIEQPAQQNFSGTKNDKKFDGGLLENYEILLLKRSSKSKFMPNLYVFPGGVAVDSDFQQGWIELFSNLGADIQQNMFSKLHAGSISSPPMFSREREARFSSMPAEIAFRICAIRETFEESGVLLAWPAKEAKAIGNALLSPSESGSWDSLFDLPIDTHCISNWRHRVNANPEEFFTMCQELDLIPAVWTLYEWSNWLTPTRAEENRRRFDTAFYICCIDHRPDAAEDEGETVNAQWATPSSVLIEHFRKKGGVAPPQVYELTRLLNFKTMRDLRQNASDPQRDRVERYFPVSVVCQDCGMGVLPGDDLYPKEPDLYSKSQVVVFPEKLAEVNAKYPKFNRTCHPFSETNDGNVLVQCSINTRRTGNVLPNMQAFNNLLLKSRL